MEFNLESHIPLTNAMIVISFMEIFNNLTRDLNDKWIKILGNYWETTMKHISSLEKVNEEEDSWEKIGNLIETNLHEDWQNNRDEWSVMDYYVHNSYITFYEPKFEKYAKYIDEVYQQEYYEYCHDSEEERQERLEIDIERGRDSRN